jgi:hypothetical protein
MSTQEHRTHIGPDSESTDLPPIDQLEGVEVREKAPTHIHEGRIL